jgi:hypothetical protein
MAFLQHRQRIATDGGTGKVKTGHAGNLGGKPPAINRAVPD